MIKLAILAVAVMLSAVPALAQHGSGGHGGGGGHEMEGGGHVGGGYIPQHGPQNQIAGRSVATSTMAPSILVRRAFMTMDSGSSTPVETRTTISTILLSMAAIWALRTRLRVPVPRRRPQSLLLQRLLLRRGAL